ncbi:uncharacterized protein UBRO_02242 [Ustilago bromivora]|uniref:Uncharacterized protein n=1 Tax=Ustilago bromivora TaxID=307758 RepID=A0A1K0GM46_9BASI|nr:uncharacterized protein UBRO_02242 [Ustilago bromivora]SYW80471.1 uncharacterized protein UBRO2_03739 [Ustilago bromivora]
MRLDWENPTEPGQQVAYTLLDCSTNCTTPAWTDPTVDSDLYILPQVLPVFNFERGFVPMELFNRALDLIAKGQDTCIGIRNLLFPGSGEDSDDGPGDDGGEGNDQDSNTGGKNTRKRKPDTSTKAGRKKRSCSTQHNESSSPPAQTAFDLNYEILKLFKDPKNKEEVGRFLALDETKVALPFRKTEQLQILCAAFPFDPSRATEPLHDEKDLSLLSFAPTPTQRSAALISTDRMLFTFGSFREGFLPDVFLPATRLGGLSGGGQTFGRMG